jgi:hypothetical protein
MPRLSKIGSAALAAFGWTTGAGVNVDYLVVAGGAGGGQGGGSGRSVRGGGAGGLLTGTASLNPTLCLIRLLLGAGGATSSISLGSGNNGSNSVFNAV